MKISTVLDTDDKFKDGLAIILGREDMSNRSLRQIYLNWLQDYETEQIKEFFKDKQYIEKQEMVLKIGDNMTYEGTVENNSLNGEGTITFKDGRCLRGFFKDNERHGLIKYAFPDDYQYE
jgi:hypothetical protein